MDKIIRTFKVNRGGREVEYPFTTYSMILGSRREKPEETPLAHNIKSCLIAYLREVFVQGVPSKLDRSVTDLSPIVTQIKQIPKSDLVDLAKAAEYHGSGNQQHERVQKYFMENDPYTIATEVPVWNSDTLGHIDILRLFAEYIEVDDFKPKAHLETKAASQVIRYVSMLSKQLGLPLRYFKARYFDDQNCYEITF